MSTQLENVIKWMKISTAEENGFRTLFRSSGGYGIWRLVASDAVNIIANKNSRSSDLQEQAITLFSFIAIRQIDAYSL